MKRVKLGRTGFDVSVMGMGAGGPSQIGKKQGKTPEHSAAILLEAFEAGVNFVDTAEGYGTEHLVGLALKDFPRDQVVISTKKSSRGSSAEEVVPSLEESLKRLGTDYIDVYSLHGVYDYDYDRCKDELFPEVVKLQQAGKIRSIGITEMFNADKSHDMLHRALDDNLWDVAMVGFNILNQSARDKVLSKAIEHDVGIQVMFAVRKALSDMEFLAETVAALIDEGHVDAADIDDPEHPLGFLVHDDGAVSLPDAAYRFCNYEPGTHVILSGTGNPDHLKQNIASLGRGPLPDADVERLKKIFRKVDSITGQGEWGGDPGPEKKA
ncbi:MAG: aldo/keto reductase [Gemmatimonadetes bacterium]|nr:aldo/keto reductase [Gemmatimonadota bacterium]|tara:strand:+ start:7829 stop:8800 length:972 start_codon:yes stop_codon:yes gene_type:complete